MQNVAMVSLDMILRGSASCTADSVVATPNTNDIGTSFRCSLRNNILSLKVYKFDVAN